MPFFDKGKSKPTAEEVLQTKKNMALILSIKYLLICTILINFLVADKTKYSTMQLQKWRVYFDLQFQGI